MCGICGIYNFDREKLVDERLLKRMNNIMAHRGPDDEGYYINQNVGFGHRRLSIIDLSSCGHQPMSNENGSIWITYNGEIYNYLELKEDLLKKGHKFKSRTDTEVIIHLYEEEGEECVSKLNGMFAFAIWDERNKRLFIVRDRLGIKPLYYTVIDNEGLLFASEIKSILQDKRVGREVNPDAVSDYFSFQDILNDKTFFRKIKILPAGHLMGCSKGNLNIRKYWDVKFIEDEVRSEEFYIENFLELFEDSVRRMMLASDVPVATYLSGGMDSGAITTFASKVMGGRIKSFTCGFDEDGSFDERRYAEIVANVAKTEHHSFALKAEDFIEFLPDLIWHLDEPRAGPSHPPYSVARLASRYAKVILAGQGGDELFAGYFHHQDMLGINTPEEFESKCYQILNFLFIDRVRQKFFSNEFLKTIEGNSPLNNLRSYYQEIKDIESFLNKMLYIDIKLYLHGLLVVEDKVSMAHSLEARVPFLDHRLVEFSATIPPQLKLKDGNLKYLTRKALSRLLPPSITQRPKQGFSPPDPHWFRNQMKDLVHNLLLSDKARSRGYFNHNFIRSIIERHMSGERDYSFRIWSLLNFELWHRIFIDGDFQEEKDLDHKICFN